MPSPVINATMQASVLSTLSNILAQFIEAHRSKLPFAIDMAQLLRFILLTILTVPPNYLWQQWLENTFPGRKSNTYVPALSGDALDAAEQGDGIYEMSEAGEAIQPEEMAKLNYKNTIIKWFVDCITMGALVNTIVFLVLMGIMKGRSVDQISSALRKDTIPIIIAGYKIWPIASVISFSFIPVERRIVFFSVVGLFWGIYMSLIAARQ